MRTMLRVLALVACCSLVHGCGAGTVTIVAAVSKSDPGNNTGTTASEFRIDDPDRISPATIFFTLVDAESDPAEVSIVLNPGAEEVPISGVTLGTETTAPQGVIHS